VPAAIEEHPVSDARPAAFLVLAAGEGTRMKSATPKVLHPLCGRSMLGHVLGTAAALDPQQLVVVVGHARELVSAEITRLAATALPVVQEPQNGTGHAVRIALETVPAAVGSVVVVPGDAPLLTTETVAELLARHAAEANAATLLSAVVPDATGYGRVLRDDTGAVTAVVEHRDATADQRTGREIATSVYAFDAALLRAALSRLRTDNAQGEEYLTDVIGLLHADGHRIGAVVAADWRETAGVNDRAQLASAHAALRDRLVHRAMLAGVSVTDPATTWLGVDVVLEPDATIHQNTQLHGRTVIHAGAVVGPNTTLTDTEVGAGATVLASTAVGALIGPAATVGPYTYLRPGTRLGAGAKAGAYVEMKAADIGPGAKVPHLSYVGDAAVGARSNIGAATVFVNYDGQHKHRTVVGDDVRIGSDTMLVAPVTVGDGAYTAAGSVITDDVPPGAIGVGRARQRNIVGWVTRRRPGTPAAAAAERAESTDGPTNGAPGSTAPASDASSDGTDQGAAP
jgi:bifunctional UDP-N-acetylglucosamine pyrophosphorylase/glucosamine-1-phosphate N-acetyltransferase